MEATDREIYGHGLMTATRLDRECVISRRDLEILLHGSEAERERGYRNLASAIAGGAGLGVASTVISHFGELLTVGLSPAEAIFLILTLSTTLAASVLAVFFHRRLVRTGADDLRLLHHQIRGQLLSDDDDPRHWP